MGGIVAGPPSMNWGKRGQSKFSPKLALAPFRNIFVNELSALVIELSVFAHLFRAARRLNKPTTDGRRRRRKC
jgi:hypothetical protein